MKDKLFHLHCNAKAAVQYYREAIAPMRILCSTWFVVQWMIGCTVRRITDGHWPGEW